MFIITCFMIRRQIVVGNKIKPTRYLLLDTFPYIKSIGLAKTYQSERSLNFLM